MNILVKWVFHKPKNDFGEYTNEPLYEYGTMIKINSNDVAVIINSYNKFIKLHISNLIYVTGDI